MIVELFPLVASAMAVSLAFLPSYLKMLLGPCR
jgi:hypothetical protein